MRKPVILSALVSGVLAAPLLAEEHTIMITTGGYFPEESQVMAGDTLRFENASGVQMTATALNGSWTTGLLNDGDTAIVNVTAGFVTEFRNAAPSTYVVDGIDSAGAQGSVIVLSSAPGLPGE